MVPPTTFHMERHLGQHLVTDWAAFHEVKTQKVEESKLGSARKEKETEQRDLEAKRGNRDRKNKEEADEVERSVGKRDGTGADGEETVKEGAEERDPGERRRWNLFEKIK